MYRFLETVRITTAVVILCLATGPTAAGAAGLLVRVVTNQSQPLAGAVIEVRSLTEPRRPPAATDATMDQQGLAFVPEVLVVPVGSRIAFPNSDMVSHQVYSFSPVKRFQLPLYRGKPYPPVRFDSPGVVTVGCNIHDNMMGYVYISDAAYFGQTAGDGSWSLPALPPGRYAVSLWHSRLRNAAKLPVQEVTVTESTATSELFFRISEPLKPQRVATQHAGWDSY